MTTLQKKAKGARPSYFQDPAVDKILAITLALAGEVAVLRDRLDTVERLAADGKPISPTAVDAFQATPDIRATRDQWRDGFLDVVLRAVHQEMEELERKAEQSPYEEAISAVEAA
ncbi:hypothetical protein HRJ34_17585 [Rhizorhabdus wittichii]|uniref:Uncharacterized protein n=1 Tax=Rhizorhabdus wittichii TaxID=160791 RepID=A0A975HC78_9SPHN|nr:hypothetical protein [Rhizorhabdus wittichii]QTH20160.1 hypothetical protein HRJ34_17585 [Rhizorhabdus wittichii]